MIGLAQLLLFGQFEEGQIGERLDVVSIINAIVFKHVVKALDLLYDAYEDFPLQIILLLQLCQ